MPSNEELYQTLVKELKTVKAEEDVWKRKVKHIEIDLQEAKIMRNRKIKQRKNVEYDKKHFWQRIKAKEYREKKKEPAMYDLCEPES